MGWSELTVIEADSAFFVERVEVEAVDAVGLGVVTEHEVGPGFFEIIV